MFCFLKILWCRLSFCDFRNGKYLAYGVNRSGSDWTTIHVIEIESRKQLKDEINWCKFSSIAWSHDEKGFFYTKYPKPRAFDNPNIKIGTETEQVIDQKVFYHKVGTSESEDELIFQVVDHPEFLYAVEGIKIFWKLNFLI